MKNLRLLRELQRQNRDRETYYVQRFAIAKVEIDSIQKYIQKAEEKFELNWLEYE